MIAFIGTGFAIINDERSRRCATQQHTEIDEHSNGFKI